jgi:hypothetical protein
LIVLAKVASRFIHRERQRQVRKWQQQQRGRQSYRPMMVSVKELLILEQLLTVSLLMPVSNALLSEA